MTLPRCIRCKGYNKSNNGDVCNDCKRKDRKLEKPDVSCVLPTLRDLGFGNNVN